MKTTLTTFTLALLFFVVTAVSPNAAFAGDNDFLLGSWKITGNDLFGTDSANYELDLTGADKKQFAIVRPLYGTEYAVFPATGAGSGECAYTNTMHIGRITPIEGGASTSVNTTAQYYLANHCDLGLRIGNQVPQEISNIAKNKNSFTMCRVGDTSKCSNWTRRGKQPKLAKGCSGKLVPPQPKITLKAYDDTFKLATLDLGFGNPNTLSYEFELIPSKIPAGSTAEKIISSSNSTILSQGLRKATWTIKYKEFCGTDPNLGSTATSKSSKAVVLKVK